MRPTYPLNLFCTPSALMVLGLQVMGQPLAAQDPAQPEVPAVFAALEGSWEGTGELMGRPGGFRMVWETRPSGFMRLSFSNAWRGEDGALTPVLSAEATYFIEGSGAVGVWVDTRPQQLTLRAVLTDSSVVTDWTADAEEGRTEYIVQSADQLLVRDHVLVDGAYRAFAEATYQRQPRGR